MRKVEDQFKKLAAIASVVLMATAEALAQDRQGRPARRIVVSIPDRKLAVLESGKVVRIFPTAVGKPSTPSPAGSYTIVQRIPNPTWYTKGKIVPPGKANPLGTRWLGLSVSGYGIHGTNSPASIGRNASHGCIRMRNHDVEQLFEMVAIGEAVELRNERTPELDQIFGPVLVAKVGPESPAQMAAQAPALAPTQNLAQTPGQAGLGNGQ
ncbi:MAG: L,D-transpeptidase [Acidobacteriia bacterium]|nr:L,D-transpeptidase [Terriglobia bacterium]